MDRIDSIHRRTLKDWVIATRPWSFTTSSIPVLVTIAYLFYLDCQGSTGQDVDWFNAILCLPLLMIIHAGGNLVSDYYDYVRGVDGPECVNGVTWIRSGLFRPSEILHFGWSLLVIGALLGLVLLLRSDFSSIWIGLLGLLLSVGYYAFKSHMLGDFDILLCFALLPSIGTCFVTTGSYHPEMLLFCLPFGLHIMAILHANNTRDIDNDRKAGLSTISGKLGLRLSQRVYAFLIIAPYAMTVAFCLLCGLSWCLLVTFLSLPVGIKAIRGMMMPDGVDSLKHLDQDTAQFQFIFGLLYALGFVAGGLI